MRSILIALTLALAADASAQQPPPPVADEVDPDGSKAPDAVVPLPAWTPVGSAFEARIKEIADHIKKNNPTNDHRVFNRIVAVTARTGSRGWLSRTLWTDGKVRFAVGRESDVIVPLAAIQAAEAKAREALGNPDATDNRRLLDWLIDDAGVAYALVARWLSVEELEAAEKR